MKLDALVVAAHPDDAEISVGGTVLRLVRAGRAVGIVDVTRGELGTRGDRATRDAESAAANEVMGIAVRHNLEQPDGRVEPSVELRERLAALFREHRPELVFAHHLEDLHPDHCAVGRLAREAWFVSGLARMAQQGGAAPAHRPRHLFHFLGHVPFEAPLVVDIDAVWEDKVRLVRCYASQLTPRDTADDGSHFLFGADILARMESKARYWGERIGVRHGEPLAHVGPVPFRDPLL